MSTRQIRKRVQKVEERGAAQRKGSSAVSVALAHAFTLEELRALKARVIGKPGAVLQDVLTPDEMAELSRKMAAAQQRPSCNGSVG